MEQNKRAYAVEIGIRLLPYINKQGYHIMSKGCNNSRFF